MKLKATKNEVNSFEMGNDFEVIRSSLLLQKSEILNKSNEFKQSQSQAEKSSDEVDNTALELQNMVSIQLHERDRKVLQLIDRTLSKFADQTYGECEACGDEIGLRRLQARPLAALCIACMEENEKAARNNQFLQ